MAATPEDSAGLEERLRKMILFNGSVPDDTEDRRPRVRLPPPTSSSGYTQVPPGMQPINPHQPPYLNHSGSSSPASPAYPGFTPPPPSSHPPHLQQVPSPYPYAPHNRHSSGNPYEAHMQLQGYVQAPNGAHNSPTGPQRPGPSRPPRQQIQLDPSAFQRGPPRGQTGNARPLPNTRTLYDPNAQSSRQGQFTFMRNDEHERKAQYLEQVAAVEVPSVDISQAECQEKETFRRVLEKICHQVCEEDPNLPKVSLECFGSFQSGFASAGSDMDLVIVVQDQASSASMFSLLEDDLPRALEKKLLRSGHGARLLTRTRVPIIKVCESPGESFLDKLREEREKWDFLPNEKKYPHLHPGVEEEAAEETNAIEAGAQDVTQVTATTGGTVDGIPVRVESTTTSTIGENGSDVQRETTTVVTAEKASPASSKDPQSVDARREQTKTWTRERKAGPLDFPKDGVGIQCDINFFNPLGLHNTQLLRCYSSCDPRVRPMVLFVKSWAKKRRINSSYSGTLSSYGYVMMVLHYLMNVAQPPVLPNLQAPWRPHPRCTPPGADRTEVDGWEVDFWRHENEIKDALHNGQISGNRESLGSLLAGFFQYYSSQGRGQQFRWTQWVLSLRTPGGILAKEQKGWVKAITEEGEGKKIQHRYLFCIEDPFELAHNVARTVTHNGIVAIRDEFRRAYRILLQIGTGIPPQDGELFAELLEADELAVATEALRIGGPDVPLKSGFEQMGNHAQPKPPKHQHPNQRHLAQKPLNGIPNNTRNLPGKPKLQSQGPDMADQHAFPTLGAAATKPKAQRKKSRQNDAGSISGDKAQEYLEEYRRKKAESEAETTAKGAAEAVLNGDD
ncbi:Terminal uridylyltransferase cid1 [Fulvia fulva]|uniref:polynucleotide adenylyltransferase n=1 Tax=Passalora fulva TaxID=5499 RepID=A0A9Q8PD92_PASFU|nr:Terminal uridylyltransferase cid1 [Fulvia fulva]UJO20310.1 Terminal uridylyltransferase cid1 [Fulvia fulva]